MFLLWGACFGGSLLGLFGYFVTRITPAAVGTYLASSIFIETAA